MSFLFGSGFCVSLILVGFLVFVLPGCTAELNRRALANWLLVPLAFRWQGGAAFGVFGRLQVTHINLRFVFLFFAHITFLSCFFGFGLF